MSKFKVGDTVRCVRSCYSQQQLTVGQEYKVAALSDSGRCICVINGSSFVFDEDRFELVVPPVPEPKFKVGDTVCCVNSHGYYGQYLTVGQEYKVEGLSIGCIRINNGSSLLFDKDRFELVVPPVPCVTYTVTWKAPVRSGYKSVVDGELSFGTKEEAVGFACLFKDDVNVKVTKD